MIFRDGVYQQMNDECIGDPTGFKLR